MTKNTTLADLCGFALWFLVALLAVPVMLVYCCLVAVGGPSGLAHHRRNGPSALPLVTLNGEGV